MTLSHQTSEIEKSRKTGFIALELDIVVGKYRLELESLVEHFQVTPIHRAIRK